MSVIGAAIPSLIRSSVRTGRPRSIASHLAMLCVAVALPILGCVSVVLWQYAVSEQRILEIRGISTARDIAEQLDADVTSLFAVLQTLSAASPMCTTDYRGFYELAAEVTRRTGLTVVLSDNGGRTIFNSQAPFGTDLPSLDSAILRVVETRQPMVTDLYMGSVVKNRMYAVAVPVSLDRSKDVTHVLSFSIDPSRLRDVLQRNVDSKDRATVIDSEGRFLVRTLNNDVAQGTLWRGFERTSKQRDGVFRLQNLEGVESVASFTRMRSTDWLVVSGVDAEVIDGPMRRLVLQLAGIAALTILVAFGIGFILSRRLLASLNMLEVNTIKIGLGAPLRRVHTPVIEVNRIGDFLAQSSLELQQANEAREALLFEVNHRVKNSLAVVTSILSMHARQAPGPLERRALLELRSRIDIIARVHQSLYESGHHNSVNVGEFLEEVAHTTAQALDVGRKCSLVVTCDPGVVMPVHRTTPLALIAAELITNAVKHAHRAGEPCTINLRFARDGENRLLLLIEDDGEGLPASFDPSRSKGVGMRIIIGLLKQLRADMQTNAGERGARFQIALDCAHLE